MGRAMAGSETRARAAEWRRQTAGLKASALAWRESETERRTILRALVKPAAALGIDLKALTAAGRDAFDKRCAEANGKAQKAAPKRGKAKS
jgi:hypothetical protein